MCPNSPAMPKRPRMTRPSSTMPPPMPVPRLTMTRWLSPRPAPKRCSAQTAALASLSTKIGSDTRLPRASRSGSLRHDRCGAKTTVARSVATNPAAPMPTAAMSSVRPASSSSTTETMVSSTTRGLVERCGVSRRARASTVPSESTMPPATLVPPMSMPMASGPSATGCLLRVVGVTDRDRPAGRGRRASRPGRRARSGGAGVGPSGRSAVGVVAVGCRWAGRRAAAREVGEHRRGQGRRGRRAWRASRG